MSTMPVAEGTKVGRSFAYRCGFYSEGLHRYGSATDTLNRECEALKGERFTVTGCSQRAPGYAWGIAVKDGKGRTIRGWAADFEEV